MTKAIRHHKMIVSNPYESTIHRTGIKPDVFSREIKMFSDPYFQQLWLNLILEHKETFIEIANHLGDYFYIPINCAHELVEQEQANLYNIIKALETDEITFNFFTSSFQNFQYKNKDLKDILKKSQKIKMVDDATYQRIYTNPRKIKLHNFERTIKKIKQETKNQEKPFQVPNEIIQKNRILKHLEYKINGRKLTVKVYNIIRKLIFENFELLDTFLNHPENPNIKYQDRPQYIPLCQQYGKAEIDYLINDYLRTVN